MVYAYIAQVIFLSHRLNIGMGIFRIMERISIHINFKYFSQIMECISIHINSEYFSRIMEHISVRINSKYFVRILFFSHLHTSIYVQHNDLKYTSYNSHHIHYVAGGKLPFSLFFFLQYLLYICT